jgi:dihydroxy-acid dehydratase
MTMGTASTMTSAAEALGLALPGSSSIPAPDSHHARMAEACGRRIVQMVWDDMRPSTFLTPGSFDNAVRVAMALGGSTNAIVHLIAMARRAGVDLDLDRFDALSRSTPLLANIRPSGKYLMEDFYYAGGLRALMARLGDLLDTSARSVSGQTIGEAVAGAKVLNDDVILPLDTPLKPEGGVAVLRGNLAPDGAVVKHSAADPRLLQHTGPAVVFRDYNDMAKRIDDPDLPVTAESVLVLQGRSAGPACRNGACCRCPKSCCARACATCSASPTPACRAPATAPACCMSARKARSAARWRWCATATRSRWTWPAAA